MADQCTATAKSTGNRCTRPVVKGLTVCRYHGGASKAARAAGQRRLQLVAAEKEVARLGARRDIHPAEALLELVHWTAGEVDYWRSRVADVAEDDLVWGLTQHREGVGPEGPVDIKTAEAKPHIAYVMLERASDRLAAYAAAALKAGVDERRVRLAESQGALVGEVLRRILDRLALTKEQLQLVPVIVPEELRRLTAGGAS